jgi:hypothetical protein
MVSSVNEKNVANNSQINSQTTSKKVVAVITVVALVAAVAIVFLNMKPANAAPEISNVQAPGCTTTYVAEASSPSGWDEILTCTDTDQPRYVTPNVDITNARALVIGGGGSGGGNYYNGGNTGGGGGGAGGWVEQSGLNFSQNENIKVSVGAGGAATTAPSGVSAPEVILLGTTNVKPTGFAGTGSRGVDSYLESSAGTITSCGGGAGQGGASNRKTFSLPQSQGASSGGVNSKYVWNGSGSEPTLTVASGVSALPSPIPNFTHGPTLSTTSGTTTIALTLAILQAITLYDGVGAPPRSDCPGQGNPGGAYDQYINDLGVRQANPPISPSTNWCTSTGGGGAGAKGGASNGECSSNSPSGAGGAGKYSDISGTFVCYAGGGGGAGTTNVDGRSADQIKDHRSALGGAYLDGGTVSEAEGGLCQGGGAGRGAYTTGTYAQFASYAGQAGTANTGGGGGGGSSYVSPGNTGTKGGNGGSGVVIMRWNWVAPRDITTGSDCDNISATAGDICITGITPSSGPVAGGNRVTISGSGFPYTAYDQYVASGIVAQFDGINNAGTGDSMHSTSTTTWKNLRGTANFADGHLCSASASAGSACAMSVAANKLFWGNQYLEFGNSNDTRAVSFPKKFSSGVMTIEIVFSKSSNTGGTYWFGDYQGTSGHNMQLDAAGTVSTQQAVTVKDASYPNSTGTVGGTGLSWVSPTKIPYYNNNTIMTYTYSTNSSAALGCRLEQFLNGKLATTNKIYKAACNFVVGTVQWALGANPNDTSTASGDNYDSAGFKDARIYSIRVYRRHLTASEIAKNAALDRMRFTNPPVVKIGGQVCTDLKITSTKLMNCLVPAGTAGPADVDLSWVSNTGEKIVHLPDGYMYGDQVPTSALNSIVGTPSASTQTVDLAVNANLFHSSDDRWVDIYRSTSDACGFDKALWQNEYSVCHPVRIAHFDRLTGDVIAFTDDPGLNPDGSHTQTLHPDQPYYYTAIVTYKNESFILEPAASFAGPSGATFSPLSAGLPGPDEGDGNDLPED